LGLTIETVSRTLSELQAAGAIELFRDRTVLEKLRN
jgi:DNA-binding transcriptional ArsR family regulator